MSDSQLRVAPATRECESYGRTDGLTKTVRDVDGPLTAVDVRRARGIESIAEVMSHGLIVSDERHDVVRTGERQPIPHYVRSAVWFRDRGLCDLCGDAEHPAKEWELDHIVPWSAGGSDDSTNLRVLCKRHNQERSNFIDPAERPRRGVTWWCANCYTYDEDSTWWWQYAGAYVACPVHRYSQFGPNSHCRVARNYWWLHEHGILEDWHQRGTVVSPSVIAFCAHCNIPALTDQPL